MAFFKYSWQYLNPLSSSGVDLFLIGTALMKLLSVSNITSRYLWPRWEVIGCNEFLEFFVRHSVDYQRRHDGFGWLMYGVQEGQCWHRQVAGWRNGCVFVSYAYVHLPCGRIFVGVVRLLGA